MNVPGESDKCALIKAYIETHIAEEITIARLAEAFAVSESTIRRNVEDCFEKTVYDYIRQQRMEKAVLLLNNLNIPIKAISSMVGFVSHGAFTHSFTEYFGYSPSHIRKSIKRPRRKRK